MQRLLFLKPAEQFWWAFKFPCQVFFKQTHPVFNQSMIKDVTVQSRIVLNTGTELSVRTAIPCRFFLNRQCRERNSWELMPMMPPDRVCRHRPFLPQPRHRPLVPRRYLLHMVRKVFFVDTARFKRIVLRELRWPYFSLVFPRTVHVYGAIPFMSAARTTSQ